MATSTDARGRQAALRILTITVAVNAAVFVALRLCAAFAPAMLPEVVDSLAVNADGWVGRPWTIVTYMFTQYDELHIILNMLWLAWFWLLLADAGISARSIACTYLAGGIAAACVYAALAPGGMLVGSSGAVLAVVAATAVAIPRRRIDLPLLRPVSVVVAAGIIIAISVACMAYGSTWSHAAHLAGISAGIVSGLIIRFQRRKSAAMPAAIPPPLPTHLMDKIRSSGYDSLSETERLAVINNSRHRAPAPRK